MRTAQASRLPGEGMDPEAVIRQARRRQRRRWLGAGVALVAVLAAAAAVIMAGGSGSRPRRPVTHPVRAAPAHAIRPAPVPGLILGGAATTVVMWPVGYPLFTSAGGPPAYVDDLTTGHLSRRQVPGIVGCDCQPYLIGVSRRLVYVGAGGTTVIPADLAGKPRVLGTTPFFAPAAAPGHIWLVRYRGPARSGGHLARGSRRGDQGHRCRAAPGGTARPQRRPGAVGSGQRTGEPAARARQRRQRPWRDFAAGRLRDRLLARRPMPDAADL